MGSASATMILDADSGMGVRITGDPARIAPPDPRSRFPGLGRGRGPIAQHLATEEAVELQAVVEAERALGVDGADLALEDARAERDADGLVAEEVEPVPFPGQGRVVLG